MRLTYPFISDRQTLVRIPDELEHLFRANLRRQIESTRLECEKTVLKDNALRLPETAVVVQAIKALGKSEMTPGVNSRIRD